LALWVLVAPSVLLTLLATDDVGTTKPSLKNINRSQSKVFQSRKHQLIHDSGSPITAPRPSELNFVPSLLQITTVGMPLTPNMELNSSLNYRLL